MQFAFYILLILDKVIANDIGNCTEKDNVECCSNFMLKEGKCVGCPSGTYGINCTKTCPNNRFGDLCSGICNCSQGQACHYKEGCIFESPEYFKEQYDICTDGRSNRRTECCVNQRQRGSHCQDCWNGNFGTNCERKCPTNRYGRFCLKKCNCTGNETCHYVTGCNISKSTGEGDLKTVDDVSFWIEIPGISLGVLIIILIGSCILIRIKMLAEKKESQSAEGNQLSSNFEPGVSVTTLLSTTACRNEEKPNVTVSDYPTPKSSQDVNLCSESYDTIMRDNTDFQHFQQNRRSIPLFSRSNTERSKMKSSTLPISRLQPNIQHSNLEAAKLHEKQWKHSNSKNSVQSFRNDIDQRMLHTVKSSGKFSCEKNITSQSQDIDCKPNQNTVRYSFVKNVSDYFPLNN